MSTATMQIEQFDSIEEKWFSYYLSELKTHGLVDHYEYQPESFILSDEYHKSLYIKKKNHNELTDVKLLNGHVYTPDFLIHWNKRAEGIAFWKDGGVYDKGVFPYSKPRRDSFIPFVAHSINDGDMVTYLDVKGAMVGRNNTSGVTFPLNQKWLASKGLFIQKIVVSLCEKGLFFRTFFPRATVAEEVYKRDYKRGGKILAQEGDSKIKVEIRLIEKWLKMKGYGKG